jgi:single-strand DNA-binding protein
MGANDINICSFTGRVGRDPDIKFSKAGKAIANISIAVGSSWKDQAGEWQEETQWVRIVAFGSLAERIGEKLSKGDFVAVAGRIQVRDWEDKDNNKRQSTEILATSVLPMLGQAGGGSGASQGGARSGQFDEGKKGGDDFEDDDPPF